MAVCVLAFGVGFFGVGFFGVGFFGDCDGDDVSVLCSATGDDGEQPRTHTSTNRLANKL